MTSNIKANKANRVWVLAGAVALLVAMMGLTACGGGAMATGNPRNGGPGDPVTFAGPPTTGLQVRLGSQPSSRVIACQLQIASLQLRSSSNSALTANLVENPISIEFARLAGTFEPIGVVFPGQGTYDQLEVKVTEANLSYLDASGAIRREVIPLSQETVIPLNPGVVVGDIPTLLNINLDLAQTAQVDLQSNSIGFANPVIAVSQSNIASDVGLPANLRKGRGSIRANSDPLNADNGGVERLVGIATQVSSSDFSLITGSGEVPVQIQFDNSTVMQQVSPETLEGMVIELNGKTQISGMLYAKELEGLFPTTGAELEGMLYTRSGAEMFTMTPQDGVGTGISDSLIGQPLPVAIGSGMSYSVPWAQGEFMGLDLPFDAAHVFPGQRVELQSSTGLTVGGETAMQPYKAQLLPQSLTGTIANYTSDTTGLPEFDMVLDGNSYLSIMNAGTYTVHVYETPMTDLSRLNGAVLDNGSIATVRGFLSCTDCDSALPGTPLHLVMVVRSFSGVQ